LASEPAEEVAAAVPVRLGRERAKSSTRRE
jgi:hypothetical protein